MDNIISCLKTEGPMTGNRLIDRSGEDRFAVWQYCHSQPGIVQAAFGKHYLRLDPHVEGYARFSPSILREFSSYTVLGTPDQTAAMTQMASELYASNVRISAEKKNLARTVLAACLESQGLTEGFNKSACAIIAGDVVYNMAHREPRPEHSTGRRVNGSDLDIVIINDGLSSATAGLLDEAIHRKKFELLTSPLYHEEIDYLIKDKARALEQMAFNGFKDMVACKILREGEYLLGNQQLLASLKLELIQRGIDDKLTRLESLAELHRQKAVIRLLAHRERDLDDDLAQLFYTTMEYEEFY